MNRTIRGALCVLTTWLLVSEQGRAAPAAKGTLKVFVLAGQSNMEGQAVVDLDHEKYYNGGRGTLAQLLRDPAKAPLFQHLKAEDGQWAARDDVWVWYRTGKGTLKAGELGIGYTPYPDRHHFGPELQFGHVIGNQLKEQVLLIKTAWGGKSLYRDFHPPSSGGQVGPYYTQMLQEVREVLGDLKKHFPSWAGRGHEIAGLVWFQGWNDMFDKAATAEYEQNLANLIRDVRKDLGVPGLPVVIGETGNGGNLAVRGAQAAAARRAEFRGDVAFVETGIFLRPAKESPNVGHGHHWFGNAESYFLIGDSMGWAMKGLLARRARAARMPAVPDLTAGGEKDNRHDWNLGPTGARGWIWGWNLETTPSRQILVTQVDKGSPADGKLQVGDVILGVDGKPFVDDARRSLGRAVTEAEKAENAGMLRLLRWRKGRQDGVEIRLPALGEYSETAPYGCGKSGKILDAGCRYIAAHMKDGIDGKINALALLASGKEQHLPLVRDYARRIAPGDLKLKLHSSSGMAAWQWGYTNLFLTEYYLATADKAVLPAIREYSANIARGQSVVGSWGHGMAWPDANNGAIHGRLGGYGALNQAGLICHLSLVLAETCGVKDDEVRRAIAMGNRFFGFYIGKGAIPYGDHRPGWQVHDDNGKDSIAAVLFDLQGHAEGAAFFSRMTVASYGERERGHTGNYFSFLWGALGAARAGDEAAAAYLKELRWYYDLARRPDGSFPYQGGAGMGGGEHQYGRWDCTGAYLLAYALPLRKLHITGKGVRPGHEFRGSDLAAVVEAGRGFHSWDMGIEPYRHQGRQELLGALRSWSPAVRHRAAQALAGRSAAVVPELLTLLAGDDLNAAYGACEALGALEDRAAQAVPALKDALSHRDLWLRIQASYALSAIGEPARPAVPAMLDLAVRDDPADPRQFMQRYLAFCLFYPGGALRMKGLLAPSPEGVDRASLNRAVERLLLNDDGRARGAVGSLYKHLTFEQLQPILPAIHRAIVEPSPSGVMFASGIRLAGLELLARHRVREGVPLCLEVMDIESWGKRNRITQCLKILQSYGGSAKFILPDLRKLERQLLDHREAKGLAEQIDLVRKTIAHIEAAPDGLPLRSIDLTVQVGEPSKR